LDITSTYRRYSAGTHAVIDLYRYERNINELKALSKPGTAFMAVVKADGYGHGAVQCALAAQPIVDWLGVARIQEALALRKRGVLAPILVLGPPNECEITEAVESNITLTVGTIDHVNQVALACRQGGHQANVHLKIDTGMRRYGFVPQDAVEVVNHIQGLDRLYLDGVYTHFSSSDETDSVPTDLQLEEFGAVLLALQSRGTLPRFVHCANSAAILTGRVGATNLVRSGIATYGISPSDEVPVTSPFKQIMSIRTVVTRDFALEPGEGVSYGLSYRASEHERVAATAAGYADGLPRQLSNAGWFAAGGTRYPIRGRVCMDQTVISAGKGLRVGETVEIVGPGHGGEMTLDDVARIAGTNSYEIATRVTARVPRVYVRSGEAVACEHMLLGEFAEAGIS
jgi:alanine racemase